MSFLLSRINSLVSCVIAGVPIGTNLGLCHLLWMLLGGRRLHAAKIERYVSRDPTNFTARRACLPPYRGKGRRPTTGSLVRPLSRTYKGRTLTATTPDRYETWQGGTRGAL
jgi:hypothetical protein